MIIIAGLILGLFYGVYKGRILSDDKADRWMYAASFTLAGFTFGLIATLFLQFIFA